MKRRILLLFARTEANALLAYQRGWVRGFLEHPRFDAVPVDVRSRTALFGLYRARRVDAVVLLHSVYSNEPLLRGPLLATVARLRAPKALFLGNEYKLMPQKLELAGQLGVDLLVSQLSAPAARALYAERLGCAVVGITSAGLDPRIFRPRTPREQRPIDLGYRAYRAPYSLGHRERELLALDVPLRLAARPLSLDVSLEPASRFDEAGWAAFLDRCKGQLGSAAGGDYFELTDVTRGRVNAFLAEHPDASFADVRERFFCGYGPSVSGRALSGRIVEAAATGTVQILLEGDYDVFEPHAHYIPLRHDLANLDEAVDILLDPRRAGAIADAAREVAQQLTYERLIDRFADALEAVLDAGPRG